MHGPSVGGQLGLISSDVGDRVVNRTEGPGDGVCAGVLDGVGVSEGAAGEAEKVGAGDWEGKATGDLVFLDFVGGEEAVGDGEGVFPPLLDFLESPPALLPNLEEPLPPLEDPLPPLPDFEEPNLELPFGLEMLLPLPLPVDDDDGTELFTFLNVGDAAGLLTFLNVGDAAGLLTFVCLLAWPSPLFPSK